jgi:uncharacterized FlaG/YvyC family protein
VRFTFAPESRAENKQQKADEEDLQKASKKLNEEKKEDKQ